MLRVGSEFSKVVEGYAAYGETISVPGTKRLREIVVESCEAMDVEMHANHDGGQRIRTWSGKDLERKLLYALVPAFGADGVTEHSISAALFEMLKSIGPGRLWLLDGRVHLLTARAADSVPDGRTTTRSGSDGDHLTLAMYYWHEPRTMTDKDGELYWNGVKLTTDVTATNPWSVVDDVLKRATEKMRVVDYAKLAKAPSEPGRQYVQAVQPALRNGHTTILDLVIPEGHEGVMVKVVSTGWCLGAMSWDQEKKECSDCLLELVKHNARHATLYIRSSHYYAWSAQVEYRECAKPAVEAEKSKITGDRIGWAAEEAAEYYAKLTPAQRATCAVLRQRAAAAAKVPVGEYSAPGEPLRVKSSKYGTFTISKEKMYRSRIEHQTAMPDPLDQVIDGQTLRYLIQADQGMQRHDCDVWRTWFTPAQRQAVSAYWSAQLRAKVEAKRKDDEAAAVSVRYCEVEPWE